MVIPQTRVFSLTEDQRAKERSVIFALTMDSVMLVSVFAVGILGGSLTMLAEGLRGGIGNLMECFALVVLRRMHRGVLVDMEYGSGKLEQVANFLIASSMLMASGWIMFGVLGIVSGRRPLGSPIGLAAAAIVGIINLYVNVLAWDSVRRVAADGESLIMQSQQQLRWVKLVASLIVGVGLTVAALSTDDVIVAWADSLGSLFVAGYLVVNAASMLRVAIPDLVDRSAGKDVREIVQRTLAAHSSEFQRVERFRSRRSGRTTFIDISLCFDVHLTISEVSRRVETIKQAIRNEIGSAEVLVESAATEGVERPLVPA